MSAFFEDVTANDINSIARTMGVINRNRIYRDENNRRENEVNRVNTERGHTQSALGALQEGKDMPSNISPSSKANAKTVFAKQKGAESTVAGHEEDINTMNRVNEIYASMGSKGVTDRRSFLKEMPVENSIDMRAMLSIQQQLGQNEKFAYEGMQQSVTTAKDLYKQHRGQMDTAVNFIKNGNMDLAERSLFDAVNKTPHPVYIEKNAQGTYNLAYEEFGQPPEAIPEGQNLTMDQAIQLISSIPPEQAVRTFTFDMVESKNQNAKVKAETWKNGTGEELEVFMMFDPYNPKKIVPQIFKKDGPRIEGSIDTLRQSGFRPVASLADQKTASEIAENKQQTATSGALQDKYSKESTESTVKSQTAKASLQGKLLDNDKKSLNMMLTPFHGGKAALFNAAGDDFSDAGKAALQKAMEFVEKHSREENLSATEKMKLNKATQAIQLWDGMTKSIAKGKGVPEPLTIKPVPVPAGSSKDAMAAIEARNKGQLKEYLYKLNKEDPAKAKAVIAELRRINSDAGAMGIPNQTKTGQEITQNSEMDPGMEKYLQPQKVQIRPELPQDMNTWNVQILSQKGKRVPVVITKKGAIPLTDEEFELYKQHAGQQQTSISAGVEWFKENATGTQILPTKSDVGAMGIPNQIKKPH